MIHGWVIAAAGSRTSHQKRSMLKITPVIQGSHPGARRAGVQAGAAAGPATSRWIETRSGTSATNTSGMSPVFGKERLRRIPERAAASGQRARPGTRLMEPDLAASLSGLVDGVDDSHDLETLLGRGLRPLSLRDAPEEMPQLELVGLLVEVPDRIQGRRNVLEAPAHLLGHPERLEQRGSLGAAQVTVREVLLQ